MQGWFNIKKIRKRCFHDKTHNKLGIEENFLNLLKGIYEKPIANVITCNGERLEDFLLKQGKRQRCLCLLLLCNIVLKGLAGQYGKNKINKIKDI